MKNSLKYILLIIVFIACVASITISVLFTRYKEQGNFSLSRKKFDVVFTNVIVDSDNVKVIFDPVNFLNINNYKKTQIKSVLFLFCIVINYLYLCFSCAY